MRREILEPMAPRNGKFIVLTLSMILFGFAAGAQLATNTHLPHFYQVNKSFYRGAQPTQSGIGLLGSLGVKTIINLRDVGEAIGDEEQWAAKAGLHYFNLPMKGFGQPPDTLVQKILSLIDDPQNQPVFLHCRRGKDRTGTIVACYRIAHDNWTSRQATKEARGLKMSWFEMGMKRYIRDFYQRRAQTGGKAAAGGGLEPNTKSSLTEVR